MLTAKSAVEDAGLRLAAVAGPQRGLAATSSQRQREFEDILSQGLSRYRKIAMSVLRNPDDAEDALQDALLSAFTHIGGFNGRAQMSTWLTRIVINAARMQMRRRRRRPTISLDESPREGQCIISELLLDPSPTPEQTLEGTQLRKLATNLIAGLPPAQRATLRLHQRDDFSIKMAADTLGVPKGTVKAQLARGRANLTERFQLVMRRVKAQARGSNVDVSAKAGSSRYDKCFARSSSQMIFKQQEGACAEWVA